MLCPLPLTFTKYDEEHRDIFVRCCAAVRRQRTPHHHLIRSRFSRLPEWHHLRSEPDLHEQSHWRRHAGTICRAALIQPCEIRIRLPSHTSLQYACAPLPNAVRCMDARFSCPASTVCAEDVKCVAEDGTVTDGILNVDAFSVAEFRDFGA
jgi:hypothetical protein